MRTEQEEFWAGEFGDSYIDRNQGPKAIAGKTAMFAKILHHTRDVQSVRELGANIGMNILALRNLLPNAGLQAVEINRRAFEQLNAIPNVMAANASLFDATEWDQVDLSFTLGVLIHLNPEMIKIAYQRLYEASRRYVLVAEYYNPKPVEVPYRGHADRLWKRDFAGEMMDIYPDLSLVYYGFIYHRDANFPADDLTWFLMEKR